MNTIYYLPTNNFFPIEKALVTSKAWLSLTKSAQNVYLIFWTKTKHAPTNPQKKGRDKKFYIENNGQIEFTYNEAKEKYGMSKSTFSNAIRDLVEKGFIDIARQGIGQCRVSSLYAISGRWRKYSTPNFEKVEVKCRVSEAGREALRRMHMERKQAKNRNRELHAYFAQFGR